MVFVFEADSEEEEREMLEDLPLSGATKPEVRRMRALGGVNRERLGDFSSYRRGFGALLVAE
jgi:hypothetical protein